MPTATEEPTGKISSEFGAKTDQVNSLMSTLKWSFKQLHDVTLNGEAVMFTFDKRQAIAEIRQNMSILGRLIKQDEKPAFVEKMFVDFTESLSFDGAVFKLAADVIGDFCGHNYDPEGKCARAYLNAARTIAHTGYSEDEAKAYKIAGNVVVLGERTLVEKDASLYRETACFQAVILGRLLHDPAVGRYISNLTIFCPGGDDVIQKLAEDLRDYKITGDDFRKKSAAHLKTMDPTVAAKPARPK